MTPGAYADTVVVIPSLHPDEAFPRFAAQLAAAGFAEVLVVDDGSGAAYADRFAAIAATPGCRVLTHEVNRGKGAALKTAFADLVVTHPEAIVVTADSDGQHTAAGIEAVAGEVRASDEENVFVLGARDVNLPHVPLASRFGNKLTTLVIKALYGQRIPDTQTGLRGVRGSLLPSLLKVRGERFDYEMNVLTWALTVALPIREIEIETIYHDATNSVSHFRPVTDSLIIYRSLLSRAGKYFLSSMAGAVVDLIAFTVLIDGIFHGRSHLWAVATATIGARVISSAVNFAINRGYVFARAGSILRYYALAALVLGMSTLGTTVLAHLFRGHVIWAKILVDVALFWFAYYAQRKWVFHGNPGERRDDAPVRTALSRLNRRSS